MTNKEVIDNAKSVMNDIVIKSRPAMDEQERRVYDCILMLTERVPYTDYDSPEKQEPEPKTTKRRIKIKISF